MHDQALGALPRVRPVHAFGARLGRGYALECAALVLLYYGAAHLGYGLRFAGPVAAVVWLPVGVAIAFLYLRGLRFWPGVVVADLLVNNYSALPVGSAIGQTAGNLLEVVVAVVLLRRLASPAAPMASTRSVVGVFAALIAGTMVSAVLGSFSTWLGGAVSAHAMPRVALTWWLGDFCGAAIVLPLALAWRRGRAARWPKGRGLEATLLMITLVALSGVAVAGTRPVSYVAFPALMWAALRFGPRGATVAVTISAAFVIWGTTHYLGGFSVRSINRSLLETQLYIAATALSTLLVAALAREREELAGNLRASRTRIVVAADEERRRIERNLHDGAQGRLLALSVRLSLAAEAAERAPATGAPALEDARDEVKLAIAELRDLVQGIHPSALRQFGLARAVEEVAARSSTPVELLELPEGRFDESAEATAYYVVLEAITNAQRYAQASLIRVSARVVGATVELDILDDGDGGAAEQDNLGLQGLRDRVEATGGKFSVETESGRGTRVAADIPLRPAPRPA